MNRRRIVNKHKKKFPNNNVNEIMQWIDDNLWLVSFLGETVLIALLLTIFPS